MKTSWFVKIALLATLLCLLVQSCKKNQENPVIITGKTGGLAFYQFIQDSILLKNVSGTDYYLKSNLLLSNQKDTMPIYPYSDSILIPTNLYYGFRSPVTITYNTDTLFILERKTGSYFHIDSVPEVWLPKQP